MNFGESVSRALPKIDSATPTTNEHSVHLRISFSNDRPSTVGQR